MTAAFSASEATAAARLGFDDAATPPWVMVPMGGARTVLLNDGTGLSLQLRPGGAATVAFREQPQAGGPRRILLTPLRAGTTVLEARDTGNSLRAALEITVKERRTLRTCLISISDAGRRMPAGIGQAQHMLEVCNRLYLPQANLELTHHASRAVALTFEMPTGMPTIFPPYRALPSWDRNTAGPLACVSSRPPGIFGKGGSTPFCILEDKLIHPMKSADDLEAIRRTQMLINVVVHVDATADYNIFFVKALDQHAAAGAAIGFTKGFTPLTPTGAAVNACIIQDSAATGQVLAHELGHFLLSPTPPFLASDRHSNGKDELMRSTQGPTDIRIPKAQANFMNPSGVP